MELNFARKPDQSQHQEPSDQPSTGPFLIDEELNPLGFDEMQARTTRKIDFVVIDADTGEDIAGILPPSCLRMARPREARRRWPSRAIRICRDDPSNLLLQLPNLFDPRISQWVAASRA